MSRRAAIVEDFDDETDLPLPARPLPNTGSRGPILEAVSDSESDDDVPNLIPPRAGPASPSQGQFGKVRQGERMWMGEEGPKDITQYKKWTCVYPIYIDAKRSYCTGERRIARGKSVWWPLSKDIADATNRLGLGTLHETNKSHPRDWENPGRVRVQWKKDGRFVNPAIKSKKQLLEMISIQIQMLKPDNVPRPPYTATSEAAVPAEPTPAASKAAAKGKQPASKTAGKGTSSTSATISSSIAPPKRSGRQLPSPPAPHPPLTSQVSPYSPALVSGVLIETIKAGMNAQEGGGVGGPGGGGGGMGGGKGKRKVVRVRG